MELWQLTQKIKNHRPTLQGGQPEYAVLVPLVEQSDGWHLLYEIRASTLHHQPGEVCFPGGQIESEESPIECALREAKEELGLTAHAVEVLGPLDFLIRGRNIVYPILARVNTASLADLSMNSAEVSNTFTVPLNWLRDHPPEMYRCTIQPHMEDFPYDAVHASPDYPWSPLAVEVPVYRGLPHPLWGLTARITSWFIEKTYQEKDS